MAKRNLRSMRLNPVLDKQIEQEAEKRGMNISEFIRYVLTSFFDQRMDSGTYSPNDDASQEATP